MTRFDVVSRIMNMKWSDFRDLCLGPFAPILTAFISTQANKDTSPFRHVTPPGVHPHLPGQAFELNRSTNPSLPIRHFLLAYSAPIPHRPYLPSSSVL
jgi:hypothetical protein